MDLLFWWLKNVVNTKLDKIHSIVSNLKNNKKKTWQTEILVKDVKVKKKLVLSYKFRWQ